MRVYIECLFTTKYKVADRQKKAEEYGFIIKQSKWPPPIRTIVSDVK